MGTSSALELTFLGHQSWHISDGDAVVLLDPILTPQFGAAGWSSRFGHRALWTSRRCRRRTR
jgi:L-ascorbate metabolism protein UlaG (beta-lactamase superfamily)